MLTRRRRGSAPAPSLISEYGVQAATILGALPDPVIVIDRNGDIRFVNPAAEQFLGSGASALCGSALTAFVAPQLRIVSSIYHDISRLHLHAARKRTRDDIADSGRWFN